MPLIFRHLAAAVLPLSATTAGILAVGIAEQLPRGPSAIAATPAIVKPLEPVPGVVANLPRGARRATVQPVDRRSAAGTGFSFEAASPPSTSTGPATPPTTTSQAPSLPRSSRKPLPSEPAAPLTPPVAPVTTTGDVVATPQATPSRHSATVRGFGALSEATTAALTRGPKAAEKRAEQAARQAEKDSKKQAADDAKDPGAVNVLAVASPTGTATEP